MTERSEFKCAIVCWSDITSFDGPWTSFAEAKALKPVSIQTIGWIIHDSDEYIIMVSSMDSKKDLVGNVNSIPITLITNIIPVSLKETKK